MSLNIISINDYKSRYPDTALNGIRDPRIQSAINLSLSYLDVKTGCAISSRWELPDSDPQHLTEEQKNYVKEAFYVETQYILSNNMDFSQGADQTSFGSLSMSSSRPERKEVCESALMYLQKAGLYDYMSFSSPSYAGSGLSTPAGVPQYDSGNEYLTQAVGDNRYVAKSQGVANKWLKTDENGNVTLTEMTLDPNNYYNRTQISELLQPLQETCNKLGLGYLKSISRNTVSKTITITDWVGNFITFPYGGSGGGGSGAVNDVIVNGVSVVTSGIAEISLVEYATKLELLALLDDEHTASNKTWSSQKIQSVFNTLSGVATIQVVEVLPSTLTNNTMYYVKIAENNYAIKLYANDTLYNMGTTQMDLTNVVSVNTDQLIIGHKKFENGKLSTYIINGANEYQTTLKYDKLVRGTVVGGTTTSFDITLPTEQGKLLLMEQKVDSMHHTGLKVIDAEENNRQTYIKPYAFIVDHPTDGLTSYEHGKIYCHTGGSGYTYTFPSHTGTLMTTGDLEPALENYYTKTQAEAKFLVKITDHLQGQSCDDLLNEVSESGQSVLFTDVQFSTAESPNEESETRWECEVHRSNSSESNEAHIIAKNYAGVYINRYLNMTWNGWEKYATESWVNWKYYDKSYIGSNFYWKAECDSTFLKRSGGSMTGSIQHPEDGGIPAIKGPNNETNVCIAMGGTYYNGGASIWLAGSNESSAHGSFGIDAYNGTTRKSLIGNASTGILSWGSNAVLTDNTLKYTYSIDGGTVNIVKCGRTAVATFNGNFGTSGGEIVLPNELKMYNTGYSINEVTAMISAGYGIGNNMRMVWVDTSKLHIASLTTTGTNYRGSLTWITQY